VLFATSFDTYTVGSFRAQAGSPGGPHMASAVKPPASSISSPIVPGQGLAEGFRNADNDAA
jgi:hypothetical protein